MANVTGSGFPGGSPQPGGSQYDFAKLYQDLLNRFRPNSGPQVTGDIGNVNPNVTYGGVGRNSGQGGARVTSGLGGTPLGAPPPGMPQMRMNPALVGNLGRFSGLGTTALIAGSSALQGDPLGAATSAAGGLAAAGLAGGVARMLPGRAGKVAQVALPAVAALLGGSAAQAVGQRVAAQVPGTPEVAQRSQEERQREFQREQNRLDYQSMSQAEFAQNKELLGYLMTQSVEQAKAMLPIQKDMLRQQLVNQQALNASNATLYQQMGRTATMGRAALANIAETGATTRALISNNPYAGSVLQAPSISFG